MGRGVSSGGGQSSLGYLFGNGEAPKAGATKAPANVSAEPVVKEAAKPAAAAAAASNPQPTDVKKVPAGVNSNINNYHRADGQNTGNFITNTGSFITDRPSTKVHNAPGGGSSLGYLFGGSGDNKQ